jgi:hypothetical protein
MKSLAFAFTIGLMAANFAAAQEFQRFTFDAGGGFTEPAGGTGRYLNNGWNAGFGVGMNFTQRFSARVEYQYTNMGVNNATTGLLGVTGADVSVYSITIDPRIRFFPRGPVGFYVVGGGGMYHLREGFNSKSSDLVLPDLPFFGVNNNQFTTPSSTAVPITLPDSSVIKPGFNVGAGVEFGHWRSAKAFAEARWEHMFMNNGTHVDFLPVTFGVSF